MRIGANPQTLSQFRLLSATREHEVGITSNRGSARHGEYVPGLCTPRPSRSGSRVKWKPLRVIHILWVKTIDKVHCSAKYCLMSLMTKICLVTGAKS